MLQFEDLKKAGKDADLYAVCNDGKRYDAYYVQRFEMIFFAIPSSIQILGYVLRNNA